MVLCPMEQLFPIFTLLPINTFFPNLTFFLNEVLFICSRAVGAQCSDEGGQYHFAITWNRFGNPQLEKWIEGTGWVVQ